MFGKYELPTRIEAGCEPSWVARDKHEAAKPRRDERRKVVEEVKRRGGEGTFFPPTLVTVAARVGGKKVQKDKRWRSRCAPTEHIEKRKEKGCWRLTKATS